MTERKYTSDFEAYETFVGGITPNEFIEPFNGSVELAIAHLYSNWVWDDELPPSWLESAITRYVIEHLDTN